jgi:hypothetical protein
MIIFDITKGTNTFGESMKHHYLKLIERELFRLWINQYSISVMELGKDKFLISDGKRGFTAKGHEIYKHIRKIPDKAGYSKFWEGMREIEKKGKVRPSKHKNTEKK